MDNNVKDFKEKMDRVVSLISTLVSHPSPTHVKKYILMGELDMISLCHSYKVSSCTDEIIFLKTKKP